MADTKISALPASTVPLAGTEVLPIVQSSATKQVSVANLTAGRAISATQLTLTTGNLIVASGQGIDFSATAGTGTSELLADYEEGTWTPVLNFGGSATGFTYAAQAGTYTKIGRQVTLFAAFALTNKGSGTGALTCTGLPFAAAAIGQPDLMLGMSFWENSPVQTAANTINFVIQSTSTINFNTVTDASFVYNTGARFNITYFTA